MITPSYAVTATERVLPRMALDFTTAVLDARVTVTRALNTATRVNSSGYIESINANLPRFDYDPVSKVCKGLLIEENRQNIFPYSNAFSTQWTSAGGSIIADDAISPSNTQTASKLTGARYRAPGLAAATRTISCFVKKLDGNHLFTIRIDSPTSLSAVYNLNTGAVSSTPAGWTTSMQDFGNGWYRCIATLPDAIVNAVLISPNGGGASCYIWEAQLEAGAFATSLIPTNGSSLTRNADIVSMTGTNFSSWYNASEGTLALQASTIAPTLSSNTTLASLYLNGSNYTRIWVFNGNPSGLIYNIISGGAESAGFSKAITVNVRFNAVASYKINKFTYAVNGGTVSEDLSGPVASAANVLYIGTLDSVNDQFSGHIAKISFYPQSLTNNEVQAFSK